MINCLTAAPVGSPRLKVRQLFQQPDIAEIDQIGPCRSATYTGELRELFQLANDRRCAPGEACELHKRRDEGVPLLWLALARFPSRVRRRVCFQKPKQAGKYRHPQASVRYAADEVPRFVAVAPTDRVFPTFPRSQIAQAFKASTLRFVRLIGGCRWARGVLTVF